MLLHSTALRGPRTSRGAASGRDGSGALSLLQCTTQSGTAGNLSVAQCTAQHRTAQRLPASLRAGKKPLSIGSSSAACSHWHAHHVRLSTARGRVAPVRCSSGGGGSDGSGPKRDPKSLGWLDGWLFDRTEQMERYIRGTMRETAEDMASPTLDAGQVARKRSVFKKGVELLVLIETYKDKLLGEDQEVFSARLLSSMEPEALDARVDEELARAGSQRAASNAAASASRFAEALQDAESRPVAEGTEERPQASTSGLGTADDLDLKSWIWTWNALKGMFNVEENRKMRVDLQTKLEELETLRPFAEGWDLKLLNFTKYLIKKQLASMDETEAAILKTEAKLLELQAEQARQGEASTSQPATEGANSATSADDSDITVVSTWADLEKLMGEDFVSLPAYVPFVSRVFSGAAVAWAGVALVQWLTGVDSFEQWTWLRGDAAQGAGVWLQWTLPYLAAVAAAWWFLPGTALAWEGQTVGETKHNSEEELVGVPPLYLASAAYCMAFVRGILFRGLVLGVISSYAAGDADTSSSLMDPSFQEDAMRSVLGSLVMPLSLPRLWLSPFLALAAGAVEAGTWRVWDEVTSTMQPSFIAINMDGNPTTLFGTPPGSPAGPPNLTAQRASTGLQAGTSGPEEVSMSVSINPSTGWWSDSAVRDFVQPVRIALNGTFLAVETLLTGSLVASVATQAAGFLLVGALEQWQAAEDTPDDDADGDPTSNEEFIASCRATLDAFEGGLNAREGGGGGGRGGGERARLQQLRRRVDELERLLAKAGTFSTGAADPTGAAAEMVRTMKESMTAELVKASTDIFQEKGGDK
ncbi:hypothetical protein WJX72_008205 [[Myrmecia] bisecta]|uniref:Uncharacterized protein n=1 Tax=[Myrmecia] bisecta TaxID=41462 RepID=A0AAW1P044_9CHLO